MLDCDDAELAALVKRCLAKEPLDRPGDAKELAAELEACASFGRWSRGDAELWWAEHQEVVAAHRPSEGSLNSSGSRPGSILGSAWRRSNRSSS